MVCVILIIPNTLDFAQSNYETAKKKQKKKKPETQRVEAEGISKNEQRH